MTKKIINKEVETLRKSIIMPLFSLFLKFIRVLFYELGSSALIESINRLKKFEYYIRKPESARVSKASTTVTGIHSNMIPLKCEDKAKHKIANYKKSISKINCQKK